MPAAVTSLDRLNALIGEVVDLRHAAALLGWDERVCMPRGGVPVHGDMLATVQRIAHEKFTSAEVGRALEDARRDIASLDQGAGLTRLVSVTARDYDRATRVPADYVAEHARVSSAAHQAWKDARERSDFAAFRPHLEKMVELKQQYTEFFQPLGHPYDAVLDAYEPGARTPDIQAMFDALRPRQVALTRAIQDCPAVEAGFLTAWYSEADMLSFARDVVTAFGFDWSRGRQDTSTHPFAIPIGTDDVRITTRFDDRHPFETLFSTMHEAGHALYEQGVSAAWNRTLARGGASLGMHESQSRLWENLIGRALPFWEHFFPRLQHTFPSQLGGVSLEAFYRAVNDVRPSLIRVEADEVTYNLHVMMRVEIEIALLTGEVEVRHAPELWNAKMQEYLGIVPASDAEGILQDMHWSIGLFGYFATYTLGNIISVQLWERFKADERDWSSHIRRGEFGQLREWLLRTVHQHGRSYEPAELVAQITGNPPTPAPYLNYLETKYGELYGLRA